MAAGFGRRSFLGYSGAFAATLIPSSLRALAPEDPAPSPAEQYRRAACISDIAVDGLYGARATADQIAALPGDALILMPGDLAYDFDGEGSPSVKYFDRLYGKDKAKIMPAPGNHDQRYYYTYFGERVDPHGVGCFEFPVNEWWTGLSIDSNRSVGRGSPQYNRVKSLMENRSMRNVVAEWHHPLVSSGQNGDNIELQDISQLLYNIFYNTGRCVVVNGHDHNYERWELQDPQGRRDDENGLHMFRAGGGGAWLYEFPRPHPMSKKRIKAHGILVFDLGRKDYRSRFIPSPEFAGAEFSDEGTHEMAA